MSVMKYATTVLLLVILITACNKQHDDEHYTYTVTNYTSQKISFDIYTSQDDYNNNRNVYKQLVFEPDEAKMLDLETLRDYYFDWYNETGNCNNWLSGIASVSTPSVKYNAPKINDNIAMTGHEPDTSKSIILSGNNTSSRWRAAQEYGNGGTIVTGPAPYIELTLRKDATATLRQKVSAGDTSTTDIYYKPANGLSNGYRTMRIDFSTSSVRTNDYPLSISFSANPGSAPHTGRDTLIATFFGSPYKYYSFVRE